MKLQAAGETEEIVIFGMVATRDGEGLLFCDFHNKSLKEWRPAEKETPRVLYRSDWNVLNVLVLNGNVNRLALIEMEPFPIDSRGERRAQKQKQWNRNQNRRSAERIVIAERDGDGFFLEKFVLLEETSIFQTSLQAASSGHLFVAFNGSHVLYELAVGRALTVPKAIQMDCLIRSATLVKSVEREVLYVCLHDNTLRAYQLGHVDSRGTELKQVSSLVVQGVEKLFWLPSRDVFLCSCWSSSQRSISLEIFKENRESQLQNERTALAAQNGIGECRIFLVNDSKLLICRPHKKELIELKLVDSR